DLSAVAGSSRQNITQTRRLDSWRIRGLCSRDVRAPDAHEPFPHQVDPTAGASRSARLIWLIQTARTCQRIHETTRSLDVLGRFVSNDFGQTETAPRKFKLGPPWPTRPRNN